MTTLTGVPSVSTAFAGPMSLAPPPVSGKIYEQILMKAEQQGLQQGVKQGRGRGRGRGRGLTRARGEGQRGGGQRGGRAATIQTDAECKITMEKLLRIICKPLNCLLNLVCN